MDAGDEDLAQSYGLGSNHFITKPENPAELERGLRSLLKNLSELSGIRRGSGSLGATAVSAVNAGSVAVREAPLFCVIPAWITAIGTILLFFFMGPLVEFLRPLLGAS